MTTTTLKDKLAAIGFDASLAGAAEDDDDKKMEEKDCRADDGDDDEDDKKSAKKAKAKSKAKVKSEEDDDTDADEDSDSDDDEDDDKKKESKSKSKARGAVSHRSIRIEERARIADIFDAASSNGHSIEVAAELAFGTDLSAAAATALLGKLTATASTGNTADSPLSKAMAHIPNTTVVTGAAETTTAADKTSNVVEFIMSQTGKHSRSRYDW